TLIGCLFVKELAAVRFAYRVAALLSAAEKRDYEELSTFRQQVSQSFFAPARRALRTANLTRSPRNPCPVCFAAALRVARERILRPAHGPGKPFLKIPSNRL
ncbi:hypothetical protein AB4Z48_32185, partial [Cupriavidus sp. 2TAF22]|uniref:hypothetical protein n=1 Tax=Cupriavidus sp. 2TAF22 TaxID=3233010 RepID=UPI003F919910